MGSLTSIRVSLRKSLRTLSARIDAAGAVLSWGLLLVATAATAWGGATMVLPTLDLQNQADQRLERQRDLIRALREEGAKLDDQIRAMESPYQVAIFARRLGFVPIDTEGQAATETVRRR